MKVCLERDAGLRVLNLRRGPAVGRYARGRIGIGGFLLVRGLLVLLGGCWGAAME